jgi:hypothetical protein
MPKEKKQSDKPSKAVEATVQLAGAAKDGFKANLPKSIDILPSTDHSGESALDVIVVFPKGMPEENVASPQTSRMLSWIQGTILSKAGSGYWPLCLCQS